MNCLEKIAPISRAKLWVQRTASLSKTYYDSQSGLQVTVGGKVMLHDITFAKNVPKLDYKLLGSVLEMKPDTMEVDVNVIKLIRDHSSSTPLFAKIDRDGTLLQMLTNEQLSALTGYVIEVSVSDSLHIRKVQLSLIKHAVALGGTVRANLLCDFSPEGTEEVISVGSAVGDLADAGAKCIILKPLDETIDKDVCRQMIEEAMWVDCAGDPIKERLGMYVPLGKDIDLDVLKQAFDLGVKHFITDASTLDKIKTVIRQS